MISSVEAYIEGAEKVSKFFGAWPSFHDAEIVEMHLWRGRIYPGDWDDRNVFPVITIKILVLEATQPTQSGSGKDLLVTLRFHDADQINVKDFNHNNSIVGLSITEQARGHYTDGEPLPPNLLVTFHSGFGVAAQFSCARIEVIGADWAIDGPIGSPMPEVG
jgi:hypothetical protein